MSPILDQHGNPIARATNPQTTGSRRPAERQNQRPYSARFDAGLTTDDNRRHWAMADGLSIDASADPSVRRTLRIRSRYEYHNNSYFMGIADTVGNYVIGTGPRLQMLLRNRYLNRAIEKLWKEWAKAVGLPQTLKTMRVARLVSGESLTVMRHNPGVQHPVKLDLYQVEVDQLTSPMLDLNLQQYPDQFFDGVVLDPWGNPMEYHVLRQHPGAFGLSMLLGTEFDAYPARYVLHDFKPIRPGQQRGIPESVPALPLFAHVRSFTLSVLGAAETAADYSAVIQTNQPNGGLDDDENAPTVYDAIPLKKRMATVLPEGYNISQIKAEQPTTTYDAFTWCIIREICRCLNIPPVFATMDSEKTNMASAYVVSQPFAKSVQVDREGYDRHLDRVLDEFLTEVIRLPGLLQSYYERAIDDDLATGRIDAAQAATFLAAFDLPDEFTRAWMWPAINTHADPSKVAASQATSLAAGTTTIPREYAKQGLDWEEEQEHAAASLGISLGEYRALLRQKLFGNGNAQAMPGAVTVAAATTNEEDDAGEETDV